MSREERKDRAEIDKLQLEEMAVLLVDDEENVLKSLRRTLRTQPYDILTASSGEEALGILSKRQVHMIVSDQRMPGMTGTEFLERAREILPSAVRILLTGYSEIKTAEDAINRVEIYRFLNKPWNDEDLKSTILQGLEKWRLEQENLQLVGLVERQNEKLREWNRELEKTVKERTRELREAQSRLIQTEKMASLGVMAGGIAHEINNPLGGILTLAQVMLMNHRGQGELGEDLENIEQAALHCSEIVKNLLNFARKKDPGSREPADVRELLYQTVMLVGHLFRRDGMDLAVEVAEDVPLVKINGQQIKQVIVNLLVNAHQAMRGKKGEVKLNVATDGGGCVCIEVTDQGEGIAKENLGRIFDPFFTTKEEGEGTGLGLSLCYRIMEEHGGRIDVRSAQGEGTVMTMVLPAEACIGVECGKSAVSGG